MRIITYASTFLLLFIFSDSFSQNKVGINTTSPIETLDVNGNANFRGLLKVNGNAGTEGQVLSSSGPGADPVWMSTAYTGGGRFWVTMANSVRTGTQTPTGRGGNWILNDGAETTQEDSIDFASSFVQGTDISVSNQGSVNNYLTINKSGLYHFEGVVRIFVTGDVDGLVMTPRATMKINLFKAGAVNSALYLEETLFQLTAQPSTGFANKSYNQTMRFSTDIHLDAGTTVAFSGGFNQLRMTGAIPLIAMGFTTGGYISGHFMAGN
jgi:hypothetical protein